MKRCVWAFMSAVFFGCMYGAVTHDSFAADKITVTDMSQRKVETPLNPKRIICLSPGTLRLIVYLQAAAKVVGVEDFEKTRPTGRPYILAHPEVAELPTVGPGGPGSINKEPDLEAVLKVQPEVIFISYMDPANADALQKKLGIPVIILTHGRFASFDDAVYGSLRVAGKILDSERRAEQVIDYIENARKDIQSRTQALRDAEKPAVYAGAVGYKGLQGIESTDAGYTPLEWVGARNLAKTIAPKDHLFVDKEKLLTWDPDVIFIDGGGLTVVKQDYKKRPQFYNGLKAYREKRIYVIYPFNYYVTNVSTAVADAYAVGKVLYPDCFTDIELKAKADEIYTFLYGKPLYEQMEKDFGPLGSVADFDK
jgi:iron complex transport system substrate-binding protein